MSKLPLNTTGIVLKKKDSTSTPTSINDTAVGVFTDSDGNLLFRDTFITEYLKKETISLKDLYTKNNGVYSENGKLYFKDSTTTRSYSLEEIINSFSSWKKKLKSGSLYWINSTELDHRSCANIPKTSTSTTNNVFWSIDRYIQEYLGVSQCQSVKAKTFYDKTVSKDGSWIWHDVQSLEIVTPPIEDKNKISMIVAKLSYNQKRGVEPIVFRLYDATTKTELCRSSIVQNNNALVGYPTSLIYFGPLPLAKFSEINVAEENNTILQCDTNQDCGCVTTDCIEGEICFAPDQQYVKETFKQNSHLIKVQFYVADYHVDHWDRYFGSDIDGESASKSSINVALFDTTPSTKYIRQHGTATFNAVSEYKIIFDTEAQTESYSINLSCNKNINVWWENKSTKGFTIRSELPFLGQVDWQILNVNA
jgi:hypothetical protein